MTSSFNLKIVVQMFYKAIFYIIIFIIIFKRSDYVCKYLNYLIHF